MKVLLIGRDLYFASSFRVRVEVVLRIFFRWRLDSWVGDFEEIEVFLKDRRRLDCVFGLSSDY